MEQAIQTDRLTGSDDNTHNYLGIACEVYNVANEPAKAISYGQQAVEAARRIGYHAGVVNHLSQLSYAFNRDGQLEKALEMSRQAVDEVEKMPVVDRNLLAISLEYVAFNLLDMKRNEEAIPVIQRAIKLQQEVGNTRSVCYDHKSLAEAFEPNHPREALQALRRYSAMMDSLHYAEMHEKLSMANAQLHNDELRQENDHTQRRARLTLWAFIIGTFLLLGVIAALAYINRLRHRTQLATQRLQKTREAFFTNVTHEFRTPLTVILGLSEQLKTMMLEDGGKRREEIEKVDTIDRNGKELMLLVNQLLDVSKVKSAIGQAQWRRSDIVPFITMITESMQSMAETKGVNLSYKPQETEVVADYVPDYAQRVISNLLSNAIKHTPKGGEVTLTTLAESDQLTLSVTDNGQGIPPEDLPHIFEPFYQGQNSRAGQGTGIGLSLVREIVEAANGTVAAVNNPEGGACFTVRMPRWQKGVTAKETAEPAQIPVETISFSPNASTGYSASSSDEDQGIRVLVVEDNPDVANYIGSLLNKRYEVVFAEDGVQGFMKAQEVVPDIIITDLMMPYADGLQLCRQIRNDELTCHIPIVVVTAKVTEKDRLKGFEAGATAYLTKPFSPDELILIVENQLQLCRQIQAKTTNNFNTTTLNEQDNLSESPLPADSTQSPDSIFEQNSRARNEQFYNRFKQLIFSQIGDGKTVSTSSLSAELCMSRSQLTRKIKAITGLAPAACIMQIRLEEAKRLLGIYPPLSMAEIAFQTGFFDHSHFSRVFRQYFGITPSQYVKQSMV